MNLGPGVFTKLPSTPLHPPSNSSAPVASSVMKSAINCCSPSWNTTAITRRLSVGKNRQVAKSEFYTAAYGRSESLTMEIADI
ncbi:unnamed protein product [Nippostrongylus brasiliensis]|uniref:Uncharacterized protein n=1 Tax=Nippostrongylus brasiliensis TaxID=27835 RepID=A0A0N4YEJ6_NIPBR|nr:unnamed protein product [Nippostrongylus brasiliensis]